jgi:mono/diheme cytochrome c family protein
VSRNFSSSRARLSLVAVALTAAIHGVVVHTAPRAIWPPPTLKATGLYSDWTHKTVAAGNLPFSPQYPLWSDGASKSRWLRIPKGKAIDAADPDAWQFPAGTRAWKEFRFGNRRVETRVIERTAGGWRYAAYAWNADESDATLVPEGGLARAAEIRDGIFHAIPSRIDCRACHEAGPARLLGVSTLQLSPDRDPLAPHAERVPEGGVDLAGLVSRGLVRNLPARFLATAPRIGARSPVARAALGYLHANCGACHTRTGELGSLSFALNYLVARAEGAPSEAQLTAVARQSRFKLMTAPDAVERICPGRPDKSVVVARMASRNPVLQMPPLGTRMVDEDAVELIRQWIAEDVRPPEQVPAGDEERR